MSCPNCELLTINGMVCHETGCPDAWKDYSRKCKWCGQDFLPEELYQECCCDDCGQAYCY